MRTSATRRHALYALSEVPSPINTLYLQLDPRTHPAMFIKTACILSGLVAFWYGAYFAFPDSFAVRV
jgi:hypothetical protein